MEKTNLHIKSFIIGFLLAIAIILLISAAGELNEVGRYQISSIDGSTDLAWIIDTRTGAVMKIDEIGSISGSRLKTGRIDGRIIQRELNQ